MPPPSPVGAPAPASPESAAPFRFWLGTHKPGWLADPRFTDVPLFVSRRTLSRLVSLPRARGPWALDSGGFTELSLFGRWTIDAATYAVEVRRFRDEIGNLAWAAPQDWMCEPVILAKTGLTVREHQRRTVANFLELRALAPDLPWVPVLQGFTLREYLDCLEMYGAAGVDLRELPLVGIGTVCRRQNTREAAAIIATLAKRGLRIHGFGVKLQGLKSSGDNLASADSLAWSLNARYRPPIPGHDLPGEGRRTGHRSCANCADYALAWRSDLLSKVGRGA